LTTWALNPLFSVENISISSSFAITSAWIISGVQSRVSP
jgi:hypothetical protein